MLYEHGPAIFYQRSKAVQDEFELIKMATLRDQALSRLADIIRDVKEERKELDDDIILETFKRINLARELTIRFVKYLAYWQGAFTQPVRPMLFEGDYLIHDFMKSTDFVNSSKIRKIFNFQFYRGNVLMLPYPNMKTVEPPKVRPELAKELEIFANPNEEDVVAAYQVLINTLPDNVYRDKLAPLDKWLIEPWTPNIIISERADEKCFTKKTTDAGADEEEEKRRASKSTAKSGSNNNSRRGSMVSGTTGKGSGKADSRRAIVVSGKGQTSNPPPPPSSSPPGKLRKGVSQKSFQGSPESKSKKSVSKSNNNAPEDDIPARERAVSIEEIPQVKIIEPKLTLEQKREIAEVEKYYQELENTFLPKINLKRSQSAEGVKSPDLLPKPSDEKDIIYKGKKIFFSTTKVQTSDEKLQLASLSKGKKGSQKKKSKKSAMVQEPDKADKVEKEKPENNAESNKDEDNPEKKDDADEKEEDEVSDLDQDEEDDDEAEDDEEDAEEAKGEEDSKAEKEDNPQEEQQKNIADDISKENDASKIKNSSPQKNPKQESRRMSEITMNMSEPGSSRRPSVTAAEGPSSSNSSKKKGKDISPQKKLSLPSIGKNKKEKEKKLEKDETQPSDELSVDIDTSSLDEYQGDNSPYRRVKKKGPKRLSISTSNIRNWYLIQQQAIAALEADNR